MIAYSLRLGAADDLQTAHLLTASRRHQRIALACVGTYTAGGPSARLQGFVPERRGTESFLKCRVVVKIAFRTESCSPTTDREDIVDVGHGAEVLSHAVEGQLRYRLALRADMVSATCICHAFGAGFQVAHCLS